MINRTLQVEIDLAQIVITNFTLFWCVKEHFDWN